MTSTEHLGICVRRNQMRYRHMMACKHSRHDIVVGDKECGINKSYRGPEACLPEVLLKEQRQWHNECEERQLPQWRGHEYLVVMNDDAQGEGEAHWECRV